MEMLTHATRTGGTLPAREPAHCLSNCSLGQHVNVWRFEFLGCHARAFSLGKSAGNMAYKCGQDTAIRAIRSAGFILLVLMLAVV